MTDNSTLLSALRGAHRATRRKRAPGCEGERNNCGGDNALCWSENNMLAARLRVCVSSGIVWECVRACVRVPSRACVRMWQQKAFFFFFFFFFSLPHLSAALQELRRRTRRPQSNGFRLFPLVSRAQRVRRTSPPIKASQQKKTKKQKQTTKWILFLTVLFFCSRQSGSWQQSYKSKQASKQTES